MKYSTVLVAAFAAGAMARAVPGDDTSSNPVLKEQADMAKSGGKTAEEYNQDDSSNYKDTSKDTSSSTYNKDTSSTYNKDTSSSYNKDTSSADNTYKTQLSDYNQKYYAPTDKSTYQQASSTPNYKPYSPAPPKDSYSPAPCYDKFQWPTNVHKEQPCSIKWQPAHSGSWTDDDDTEIHLYHCNDYSKPHSIVCKDDCGKGSYDKWQPPSDCESSDSDNGAMYRFKFIKKSDNTQCTWGQEFPIYGSTYNQAKSSECPPPAPVPNCPSAPPAPPAGYQAPAASAAPVASAAPSYPAPAASAAPAAAPMASAAPAAAPAVYPAAQAPTQGVANETTVAPAALGASSAIRASLSVIVGVAALVTFAL